ncbi:S8 family serine peptidase [Umezawaea sp. Da 62-37]|uniref:S8 family serine peptidase n=1 Tax=Umezawaea sp. Da 62-37 TaxID=3075927 RepID=UPI0028F7341C|nr:S8 family serine peptidase [Umezawaea sp. Da 62-37]WNV83866.1 S8 family serine peptidase [Umezawaea sp. Da 62-37]
MSQPTSAETTGRYLVLLETGSTAAGVRELDRVAGIQVASTADTVAEQIASSDGVIFHELGIALVEASPDQLPGLNRAVDEPGPVLAVEAERVVHAITSADTGTDVSAVDESAFTWGLQAVGANLSTATGKGIRVAVLDTGFTVAHADFAGRVVTTSSFVTGETVDDAHGHGTHCVGVSCGPRKPATGPGYGVAHEAEIYAGKVLGNSGSGSDGGILAGIEWAIANGCAVVSMSLGAATRPGTPHSVIFEQAASRALAKGTLIIAAAGNESRRPGVVSPVGHPANCPSIMAVGATDAQGALGFFSCGTVDAVGAVDVVAPGVDVYSSWNAAPGTKRLQGTSMATPHVAGVAALMAERYGARGFELWARLGQTARRLPLSSTDVGAGLVQAP